MFLHKWRERLQWHIQALPRTYTSHTLTADWSIAIALLAIFVLPATWFTETQLALVIALYSNHHCG